MTPLERHIKANALWQIRKHGLLEKCRSVKTDCKYIHYPIRSDCTFDSLVFDVADQQFTQVRYMYRNPKGRISLRFVSLNYPPTP